MAWTHSCSNDDLQLSVADEGNFVLLCSPATFEQRWRASDEYLFATEKAEATTRPQCCESTVDGCLYVRCFWVSWRMRDTAGRTLPFPKPMHWPRLATSADTVPL
mgnify:CR=1 FL=1